MNLLDVRTVVFSYAISNIICMVVMAILWKQNRRHFSGLGFWLVDFVLQFISLVLVTLRGRVPDFLSMTVSNALIIGGTMLLYIGFGYFTGIRSRQVHNGVLLATFIIAHAYFVFVLPSLTVRNIIFSLGLLVICSQCAWLMLRGGHPELRIVTSGVGYVFVGFCLVSITRIVVDLAIPLENDFFHSSAYDTLLLITYQMLFIILTLSLSLMVNRRLFVDLEADSAKRKQAEVALRLSEEKFFKAFQSSPDAIIISRLSDGQFVDVNEGFCRLTEYSREEALSTSSIGLGIWNNPQDRDRLIATLSGKPNIRDIEYDFRTKSGKVLNCIYSGEIIILGVEAYILSVVRDVTERKKAVEALRQSERRFRALVEQAGDGFELMDAVGKYIDVNETTCRILGYTRHELLQLKISDIDPNYNLEKYAEQFQVLPGKPALTYEAYRRHKNGTKFPVEVTASIIQIGADYFVISMVRDITVRKRVEEIMHLRLRLWEYATTNSIDNLMQKALDEIGELTVSPIGFYHFVEEDQNTLSLQAWSTRTKDEFCKAEGKGMHYPINEAGVWVDCVRQRKPVIHNDYGSLPHRKGMPVGHAEVVRELVVPTMRNDRIVSILGVGNKPTDYTEKDIELVSFIADIIWTIVEQKRADEHIRHLNAKLEQLAMTDELTGLANRRSFFMRGHEEIKRARRYQTPLSLLMLDIDEFKNVNDTYGHDAGDQILQHTAHTLQDNIREIDVLARLGGEEFGILLPNTEAVAAVNLAERLRLATERGKYTIQSQEIKVTVSIGVVTYHMDMLTLDDLLKNADAVMYQAKNLGRNRVVF